MSATEYVNFWEQNLNKSIGPTIYAIEETQLTFERREEETVEYAN